jgi:hypothetical protein
MGMRDGWLRRLCVAVLWTAILSLARPAGAAEQSIGPTYLRLTPISFSVIGDDNKIDFTVDVILALELKPGVTEAMLSPYQPKIQDQALIALTDLWESRPMSAIVPTTQIKQTLLPIIVGIAGKDKVEQVLILGLGERRRS